jgi:hypothetical protein
MRRLLPVRAMTSKPLRQALLLSGVLGCVSAQAASDYRLGFSMGYGGGGIQIQQNLSPDPTLEQLFTVKRSQGPGVFSVFVDQMIDDRFGISLEHFRAFTLAPFSSKVHFTGVAGRYYITPAISAPTSSTTDTVMRVKRFAFFAGLSTGVALGTVVLEGDQVPEVSSSGIYFGAKLGADYALSNSVGLRPEISYAMTLVSQGATPSNMLQFGVSIGVFLFL